MAKVIAFNGNDFDYNLVNLTPHSIFITANLSGTIIYEIKPSGVITRVNKPIIEYSHSIKSKLYSDADIKIASIQSGDIIDLPDPKQRTLYIVSGLTARIISEQLPYRNDILSVDSKHIRKKFSCGELPTVFRLLRYQKKETTSER